MNYAKICAFFEQVNQTYHTQICVKDFLGFLTINPELEVSIQPYLSHVTPFCLYMKSDKKVYLKCVSMVDKMRDKIEGCNKAFCGSCHVGLREYVVPIMRDGKALGSINIGFFVEDEQELKKRLFAVCEGSKILRYETALELFHNTVEYATYPVELLLPTMEVIADYLAASYPTVDGTIAVEPKRGGDSNEEAILSHALVYIKDNLRGKIYVDDIAAYCFCSASYLSHIFKKRIHMPLSAYINKSRVELAKKYLVYTTMSLTTVSISVGFDDPNYFSRIFAREVGIPPRQFRAQYNEMEEVVPVEFSFPRLRPRNHLDENADLPVMTQPLAMPKQPAEQPVEPPTEQPTK